MSPPPGPPMRGKVPQKAKNAKKAWGDLIRYCKPYSLAIIISFVFAITAAVIRVIGPRQVGKLSGYLYRQLAPPFPHISTFMDSITKIATLLVILYVTMFVISFLQQFIMSTVTQRIAKSLRKNISGKINRLPLRYFDKTSVGDTLSRVSNDVDTLSTSLNQSIVSLVSSVTLLVGAVAMMLYYNWILALTAIGASLIGFMAMAMIIKRSQKHFIAQQKQLGIINGHIEEYYSGSTVVNVSNAKKQVNAKFGAMNNKLYDSAWRSQFFSGIMQPLMNFVSNFGYVAVCTIGGVLVFNGSIPPEILVSFLIYVRIFNEPLGTIAQAAMNLQSTAAASERVFEFLREPEMESESNLHSSIPQKVKGDISFRHVKFGYTADKTIIKDFNENIPAGSKVAIVGPTGAGKTTIVNLLMKFYKTDSGDITIDGIPINNLPSGTVRDLFGMVLQDTWLFEGTVRENLVYNMAGVTDDQIQSACVATGIDHFIRTLPKGYDTVLNEQASISNGQKQLVTIARAMIKNAPLLILDEATSSVDTRTEMLIAEAMDKLTHGRTSFVIAHRLSTIKNADIILVMKDGEIIETGNHQNLIGQKGFYAELYNSQFTLG